MFYLFPVLPNVRGVGGNNSGIKLRSQTTARLPVYLLYSIDYFIPFHDLNPPPPNPCHVVRKYPPIAVNQEVK